MHICRAVGDAFFRLSTQQNWPRDKKLIQSCWYHYCAKIKARKQRPLLRAKEKKSQNTSYRFSILQYYVQFWILLCVERESRSLGYQVLVISSHFLSIWTIWAVVIRMTDIHFLAKDHLLLLQEMWSCLPLRMGNTTRKVCLPSTVISPLKRKALISGAAKIASSFGLTSDSQLRFGHCWHYIPSPTEFHFLCSRVNLPRAYVDRVYHWEILGLARLVNPTPLFYYNEKVIQVLSMVNNWPLYSKRNYTFTLIEQYHEFRDIPHLLVREWTQCCSQLD